MPEQQHEFDHRSRFLVCDGPGTPAALYRSSGVAAETPAEDHAYQKRDRDRLPWLDWIGLRRVAGDLVDRVAVQIRGAFQAARKLLRLPDGEIVAGAERLGPDAPAAEINWSAAVSLVA